MLNRHLAALDLFTLSNDHGATSMTKTAALCLPSFDPHWNLQEFCFCDISTRGSCPSRSHQATSFVKPFIADTPDDVVLLVVSLRHEIAFEQLSFIVCPSAIIHHNSNFEQTIPWDSWGSPATRWFYGSLPNNCVCGYQCLRSFQSSMEVLDFNPYRVKYLGKGFVSDNETGRLTVETEPSVVYSPWIPGGLYSSLPYVKLLLKYPNLKLYYVYNDIFLDDDRIFMQCVRPPFLHRSSLFDEVPRRITVMQWNSSISGSNYYNLRRF